MIRRVAVAAAAVALGCGPPPRRGTSSLAWVDDVSLTVRTPAPPPPHVTTVADTYRAVVAKIIAAARADHGAYDKLRHLTDEIGNRISGSAQLDQAIAWAAQAMRDDGHDVHTEDVMIPRWVRGAESATLVAPRAKKLAVIGLGGTIPTKKGGVTARVVVVHDWDELEAKKADVAGAIVLFDVALPAWSRSKGSGYGDVVPYRVRGAVEAARRGAVGVLMRSVTAHSLGVPHTGAMAYDDAVPKIPAAAVSVEDATLIARLVAAGDKVEVKLELQSKVLPDVKSANVIGELRGRELPDEVVVIGAHLDSWDVGQGAHDDGAGVVTMMQALTTLRKLGLAPRRTIRVVLYTNEENGTRGAKAYLAAHQDQLALHAAAIESDGGGFTPIGFEVDASADETRTRIQDRVGTLVSALRPLGDLEVTTGHAGSDIDPLVKAGVPGLGLSTDNRTYFDVHHTVADTLDKVDPDELAGDVAAVAAMAYVLADLPARLDAPADEPVFQTVDATAPATTGP